MGRRGQNVTIKTIAEEMGVSFSTVSKALNGDPLVKKETREAVVRKAKEMGYAPNLNAKGLRCNRTNTVGMILNDVENPTFAHMLSVIASGLALMGYTAVICDSHYDEEMELLNIQTMRARNTEAIIYSPVNPDSKNVELLKDIAKNVIVLGGSIPGFPCNYVTVDYRLGGYLAAKAVLSAGHTENLVISEVQTTGTSRQYVGGVQRAYAEFGVPFDAAGLFHTIPSIEAGCRIVLNAVRAGRRVTSAICGCDSLAYGVYLAAEKLNLRIPEDISVVGFDDYGPSQFCAPKLSTVYLPKERMATCCLELLREVLGGTMDSVRSVVLEPYFVERRSIAYL